MNERLLLKKCGRARFISHLDLMRIMQRSFNRAGVKIKHTSGFNPHPYISFALPLPVGTESAVELMDFELIGDTPLEDIPGLINSGLPDGMEALSAYRSERKFKHIKWLSIEARLEYDSGVPGNALDAITELYGRETLEILRKTKRGEAVADIRPQYRNLTVSALSPTELSVRAELSAQDPSLPPAALISAISEKLPELAPDFASFRRVEVYDAEGNIFR